MEVNGVLTIRTVDDFRIAGTTRLQGGVHEIIIDTRGIGRGFIIHNDELATLLNILKTSACKRLTLTNVAITANLLAIVNDVSDLQTVTLSMFTGSMPFINFLLKRCPNLKSLVEIKSPKRPSAIGSSKRVERALLVYERLFTTMRSHYGLLAFESSTLLAEIKVLKEAGMSPSQKMQLLEADRKVQALLLRNQAGYHKCQRAIYQVLLIKKYRPSSVFRFINRDVVMLIVRWVHGTIGSAVWCQ